MAACVSQYSHDRIGDDCYHAAGLFVYMCLRPVLWQTFPAYAEILQPEDFGRSAPCWLPRRLMPAAYAEILQPEDFGRSAPLVLF